MNQSVQQRGSNAPKHTNFYRKWAWFTKISRARKRAHFCAPPNYKSWLRHCVQHNNYFSYKFKIVNNKEKPSTTGKLNQWWKQRRLSTFMILNCTSLKSKKDTNKKLKRLLSKSKGCRVVKSTTGSQCKLTRNKHGMVTRLTC